MLAASFTLGDFHMPYIPSPLSPPQERATPLSFSNGSAQNAAAHRSIPASPSSSMRRRLDDPYSKRITRENPLIHGRGDGREARRSLFLKKVREGSEGKRLLARGGEDEMMRTIWVAEQKRRAERQARDATNMPSPQEEEYPEEGNSFDMGSKDEEMVDEVAQQENAEIEALLSLLEEEEKDAPGQPVDRHGNPYESDDEDYDDIFLSIVPDETTELDQRRQSDMEGLGNAASTRSSQADETCHEAMDTT